MSVISAREKLWAAMDAGISPTIEALIEFREELDDFLIMVNDYDEWDADRETVVDNGDHGLEFVHDPAVTVQKLRKMLGYAS